MSWRAHHFPWIRCWAAYWFLSEPALRRLYPPSSPPRSSGELLLLGPPLGHPIPPPQLEVSTREIPCGGGAVALDSLLTGKTVSTRCAALNSRRHVCVVYISRLITYIDDINSWECGLTVVLSEGLRRCVPYSAACLTAGLCSCGDRKCATFKCIRKYHIPV